MTKYGVNEVYRSVQGEGYRAYERSVFLRFSGCNMRCRKETHGFDCDTEFASGRVMSGEDIVRWVIEEDGNEPCMWVVATGGEPGLQLDEGLIDLLHAAGYKIQIETNGSIEVPASIDFVTVSPKVAEHCIRQLTATEVKYVRGYGQALPKTVVEAEHYYVSPAFNGTTPDTRAMQWCRELVKGTKWKVSLQQHKIDNVR